MIIRKPLIVFIIITSLFIAYFLIFRLDNKKLYSDYYNIYPIVVTNFDWASDEEKELVLEFFNYYKDGNYSEAISVYSSIDEAYRELYLDFYAAQCYLAINKYDIAQTILIDIKNVKRGFYDESLWYLALIEIKQNNMSAAMSLLETIEDSSNYKVQQSKEIKALLN